MRQDHPGRNPDREQDIGQDHPPDTLDKLTVAEAAERLGVTQDAVRKRMARGTIRHLREDGRLYVYLDAFERASKTVQEEGQDEASKMVQDHGQDRYVAALEDQIQFLRRELERKDAILLRLTERIPELEAAPAPEAPPSPRESPTEPADVGEGVEDPEPVSDPQTTARRPWWLRVFGG